MILRLKLDELNNGINGNYGTIYNIFSGDIPYQGEISYDLYLYIDGSVTSETMGQTFSAGIAVKSYEREPDPTSLALDISLGNIIIYEGSTENTLYVSGGGLAEQIEIDNTLPIVITGTTEEYGIEVYGGTSNITLNNVGIKSSHIGEDGVNSGPIRLENDAMVNLNIEGENSINAIENNGISRCSVGIYVPSASTLIIGGNGTINVISNFGTGIGTNYMGYTVGTIIINSGIINATSTTGGAAIGGYDFNLIEINGGNVTTISNGIGASIGGTGGVTGDIGNYITGEIIINNGNVTAISNGSGAGIGGGGNDRVMCYQTTAPNIYISDIANVTAIAGENNGDIPPENIGNSSGCVG